MFCKGIAKSGGDWVMSLVQEAPTSAGGVLQFDLSSKVGAVKASSTPVEEGSIAGWATHYWFLPAEQKVALIKLDASPPSKLKMLHYVKGFMARFASCVQVQGDDSLLYVSPSNVPLACRVKFDLDPGRDAETEQRILAGKVERVILRESVPVFLPKRQPARTGLLSIFGPLFEKHAPRSRPLEEVESSRVEARIVKELTKEQTKALIDGWHHELDPWANLGFVVKTDTRRDTLWLERQRGVAHVELRVQRDDQGVVNLESLANVLHDRRSAILDSFRSTS